LVLWALCAGVAKAQPINDNFVSRFIIADGDTTISGTLSNATFETGEPFLPGISSGQTAWWTWIAPSNGIVTLSVGGTGFNPLLTVYTGNDLANLSLIASNNYLACYESTNCGCHWRIRNQSTFHVARGQAYQVAVDSEIITDSGWVMRSISPDNLIWPTPPFIWGFQFLTYWVPVQITNMLAGGDVQLGFQFTPAPTNDDFESRVVLSGSRKQITISNAGATKQVGEPEYLGNPGGSSVWYSWKAPTSGRITLSINNIAPYLPPSWSGYYGVGVYGLWQTFGYWPSTPTCGSEIDQNPPPPFYPVFAAYTGTNLSSLVLASNCLPMNVDAYPNAVEFDAIKGQTYQVAFDGNMGTTGTIPLFLAVTTPASNDNFKNRIKLHGINVAATGFNAGATHETGEPFVSGSYGKSVWWSWTAPVSGTVAIDLTGSDHSFPVGVFVRTSVANLNPIAAGSGGVSFDAVQGQTYQLAVNDASGLTGAIKLKLQAPVVGLPLARTLVRSGNVALLSFTVSPHQVILLQSSNDGSTWKDVSTAMTRQATINFLARPAPTDNGPYYRAIVVDYQ
jgi:hypothetical protein